MSYEIKKIYKNHEHVFRFIIILIMLPLFLILTELILSAILNLGTYVGTFLRCLYELVVF